MHPVITPSSADLSFQALVECAEDIITVVEADGRIVYDSPAVERVLGYRQGELVGRSAFELVHGDDLPAAYTLLADTVGRPGTPGSLTFRFLHRDGSWRWLASVGRLMTSSSAARLVITSREVAPPAHVAAPLAGEVEAAHLEMLQRLALAAEFRDDDTGQHTRRVGELSAELARSLGLEEREVELIRRAAPLHDVGKVGIPDAILRKPGPLSPDELVVMRTHTVLGARLLSQGRSALVRAAEQIALCHHERWDGSGYPSGLAAESIPLGARIVAIVDFWDALTHDRPYRPAWPPRRVSEMIEQGIGTHFDPALADAFLRVPAREEKPA